MPMQPRERMGDWQAAALLGLLTSGFSTLAVTLASARTGRDVSVDWMMVGSILLRDGGLQAEPGWRELGVGILIHLSAGFFWAVVFFGLLGRWTARRSPWALLPVALAWAPLTSGIEYALILPWLQPLFVMQQPYWTGLAVHLIASSLYPLYPWIRDRLAGRRSPWAGFARVWGSLAAAGLVVLAALAILGSRDREPPWLALLGAHGVAFDRGFLRRMTADHAMGVEMARLAAERAEDPELRSLARLMIADQSGEMAIMERWWRSWFAPAMPPLSPAEHAVMPGMPAPEEVMRLEAASGRTFDGAFVNVMTRHHEGAIAMAEEAMARAADPRVWLIAQSIRHARRNQVAVLRGLAAGREAEEPLAPGETPATAAHDAPHGQGQAAPGREGTTP